jgi:pilus assembly protein FimV
VRKKFMNDFEGNKRFYPSKTGSDTGTTRSSPENFGLTEDMLEQYGVWIKVEPEVILEDTAYRDYGKKETRSADYFDLDEMPEDEAAAQSGDEDISFSDIEIPSEEEIDYSGSGESEKTPFYSDGVAEPGTFEEELPGESEDTFSGGVVGEGINEDFDMEEPIDLASEEIEVGDDSGVENFSPETGEESELFSAGIDDFSDLELENLPDIDAGEALGEIDESEILPEIDAEEGPGELELEENIDNAEEMDSTESGGYDIPSFEDGIEDIGTFDSREEVEVPLSSDQHSAGRVDDIDHLETGLQSHNDEMFSSLEKSSIFGKIERELFAIKKELSEIRTELATGRSGGEHVQQKAAARAGEEQVGFFDEEEDETIALTGDELNNILNNADITEGIPDEFSSGGEETGGGTRDRGATQQKKAEDLRYESTPIDKIELEETEMLDTGTPGGRSAPEVSGSGPSDIAFDEIEIPEDSEIAFESVGEESPTEIGETRITDDIALEDEIDLGSEEEEGRSVPVSVGQDNIEDLLSKDLEDTEEIELSPHVYAENEIGAGPGADTEAQELEDEEAEVVEGIDFDLPDEESFIAESEDMKSVEDIELPVMEDEIENVTDMISGIGNENIETVDNLSEIPEIGESEMIEELEPESASAEAEEIPVLEEEELIPLDTTVEGEPPGEIGAGAASDTGDSLEIEEILPEEEIDLVSDEEFIIPEAEEQVSEPVSGAHELEETEISFPPANAEATPETTSPAEREGEGDIAFLPSNIKSELKSVLSYLDQLLASLPDEKVEEFSKSDYFTTYRKLFEELGLSS